MSRFVPRWVLSQVSEGRHKYAAHKIALLYHAINTSKLCRDHLRKRIEEHFEDIKEVCTAQLLACASHAPHHVPACTAPRACMPDHGRRLRLPSRLHCQRPSSSGS